MAGNYIQRLFAERIGGQSFGKDSVLYKFEKIKRAKAAARLAHPDVPLIDMGVGEPDDRADDGIIRALAIEAAKRENRFYADNGIPEFRRAASRYLADVYGVSDVDPEREVVHAIGSKSALAMLPSAFINPGDIAILPVPNYPVLGTHTRWLGGQVFTLPITPENHFLPELNKIPPDVLDRSKLLYLNYPNNPTGATATREFFEQVVDFAERHRLLVVHDAAYSALTFDGEPPLSFLSVPGAKNVGIELFSMSKAFNMTGWRIAFAAGNELAIKALATVKDNNDSGQFMAIQKAAMYGLEHPEITRTIADKYSRRHDLLVGALESVGFSATKPKGSFFLYTPAPKKVVGGPSFASAEDFSQYLITEKQISTVPWDDAGSYVRWSVTFEADGEAAESAVIEEIKARLSDVRFEF